MNPYARLFLILLMAFCVGVMGGLFGIGGGALLVPLLVLVFRPPQQNLWADSGSGSRPSV